MLLKFACRLSKAFLYSLIMILEQLAKEVHADMLAEHYNIKLGKFESNKLWVYWLSVPHKLLNQVNLINN